MMFRMELGAGDSVTCSKCGSAVAADERFCTTCGADLAIVLAGGIAQDPPPLSPPTIVPLEPNPAHGSARKWLLAISIITLISGFIFYAMQKSDVEKEIRAAEAATEYMDPAERDRLMVQEVGMTFQEALDHDRGMVTMLLVVNIALAVIYFGLWIWAKRNPYLAALIALLLFLTVIVVSAVIEPKSLAQGVLLKILFIMALARAVKAGADERRLAGVA